MIEKRDGKYFLTPTADVFLVKEKPSYVGDFRHVALALWDGMAHLKESLKTGKPLSRMDTGAELQVWEKLVLGIIVIAEPAAKALCDILKIGRERKGIQVLDIAGGSSIFGMTILSREIAPQQVPEAKTTWSEPRPMARMLIQTETSRPSRLGRSSRQRRRERRMTTELDTFYEMVEDIGVAMMTTRRPDGHLESRAMANQKRAAGADLWFVTAEGTGKLRSLEADPHINLSYYKDRTREWISVSGLATISRDRQKIRELYAPDWKMWFPDEGDARDGTPDDPRLVLIGVEIHAAVFLEVDKPQPVVLYELMKGWLTGTEPELGKLHTLNP